MKIVHIITRFMRGGADENTLLSCNAQAAAGDEVHLIYGGEFSPEMLALVDGRVRLYCVPSLVRPVHPLKDVQALVALRERIKNIQPDIVHTHTSKAGILGRAAAWVTRTPGVIHGVHILPFDNVPLIEKAVYLGLERLFAPVTHAFVNVSGGMQQLGLQYNVGRPERHHVIPSGMDVGSFRKAEPFTSAEIEARLGALPPNASLIVLVAALEPRKRQYEFLDVFSRVSNRLPHAQLVLLGEGSDEARLRGRVEELGLASAVHFLGFSTEVARWIASAGVCAFASEREGLPRAVIQYAMVGAPVVSTRLPGIERVVSDGQSGVLVNVSDLTGMEQPIIDYLEDQDRAARARKAAHEIDFSAWEIESMVARLGDVYRAVLADSPAGRLPATA